MSVWVWQSLSFHSKQKKRCDDFEKTKQGRAGDNHFLAFLISYKDFKMVHLCFLEGYKAVLQTFYFSTNTTAN